jgi:hypothetical protein
MKQRKTTTLIVLALEIATIVALHAIKINQEGKALNQKDMTRSTVTGQRDTPVRSFNSFAGLW